MDLHTVYQINRINIDFYNRVGAPFDASRNYVPPGWYRVVEHIRPRAAGGVYRVLDVGCGGGQFGRFLLDHLAAPLFYHGVDPNAFLLNAARAAVPQEATFSSIDLVTDFDRFQQIPEKYHLVVLNNVLHHIPSFEFRCRLLAACAEKLYTGGLLIFTLWQFLTKAKWQQRIIPWAAYPHIDPAQLEPHDYLLDWQRRVRAVRYCHFTDAGELERLVEALRASLAVVETFLADGKENDLNRYVVLDRREP